MAGYKGHSKSWNAIEAEKEGKFPCSVCAKKTGVPAPLIRQFIRPCEWHHTSKWYNETDYFRLKAVEIIFGRTPPDDDAGYQPNPAAIQALKDYRQCVRKAEAQVHANCKVEWLEWSGSRTHPVSKRRVAYDCTVSVKGVTATITFADGKTMVKRLATRGFHFWPDKNADSERAEVERQRQKQLQKQVKKAARAQTRREQEMALYEAETARRRELVDQTLKEILPLLSARSERGINDPELHDIMRKHMPCLMRIGSNKARSHARRQIRAAIRRRTADWNLRKVTNAYA